MDISIDKIEDYGIFFDLCGNKLIEEESIIIQYNLKFLNPHDVLLIVQFAIFIIKENPNISCIKINSEPRLGEYLKDIGLALFLRENYKQPKTIKFIKKQTAMPIRRVERSSIEEYVYETLRYIGGICKGKDLTVLSIGIKESINNVHDHANSKIGAYVFCQYYHAIKTVRMCVSDLGDGIPNVVRKSFPGYSDEECLKWALKEKNTTKSLPSNAGMGLSTIRSFTKANKGKLQIRSGTCYYSIKDGKEYFMHNNISSFKGTIIELDINVEKLDDRSESEIEDTF